MQACQRRQILESKNSSFINMHSMLDVLERLGHNFRILPRRGSYFSTCISRYMNDTVQELIN